MKDEPFPILNGVVYKKYEKEYFERLEYMSHRVEEYLDNFRKSIEYDFTKVGRKVEEAQKELLEAIEKFAIGELTAPMVKDFAIKLKYTFRRPNQTRSLNNQAKTRNKPLSEDNYLPGSFYTQEAQKFTGERLRVWIRLCNSRVIFPSDNAIKNKPFVLMNPQTGQARGYDANGKFISVFEAERLINLEMLEIMQETFKEDLYKIEEEQFKPKPFIGTEGKTIDEVKKDLEVALIEEKNKKRAKRK